MQSYEFERQMGIALSKDREYFPAEIIGINPDVDLAAAEDVWDAGGDYTFSAAAAAHFISSSHAGDTQEFEVKGLDANWVEQAVSVTAAGQTKTAITGTFIRILSVRNTGAAQQGDVYVYEDDVVVAGVPTTATKVRAKSILANNQSRMGIYSIPADRTGLLLKWDGNLVKAFDGTLEVWIREFGGAFALYDTMYLLQEYLPRVLSIPKVLNTKCDVKLRFTATADNTVARAGMNILLRK